MFIVLLKFGANKAQAGEYMDGHNARIQRGFDDGIFLLVGSLDPGPGGGILAHNTSLTELEARVGLDPFVEHGVVETEVQRLDVARAVNRLSSLLD